MYYDEAIFLNGAVQVLSSGQEPSFAHDPWSWVTILGRRWPIMVMPYIGPMRDYLALLPFSLFGPNYLSAPSDLRVLISGIDQTRKIFSQPAMAPYTVEETVPGPSIASEAQFAEFARNAGTNVFHPVGTCKMGTDPMAVVDPRLRVIGVSGLRVIDASIMPAVTTGNTNAPAIMIGEKGAQMIKEDAREQPAAAAA